LIDNRASKIRLELVLFLEEWNDNFENKKFTSWDRKERDRVQNWKAKNKLILLRNLEKQKTL